MGTGKAMDQHAVSSSDKIEPSKINKQSIAKLSSPQVLS